MVGGGRSILCVIGAVLFVLTAAFMVVAADQQTPDTVSIKAGLWTAHTKTSPQLSHKKHAEEYKVACADCHHKYEGGKNVWKQGDAVEKCEKCHTDPTIEGEKKLPEAQQKLNLKLAFHNNCQGCHQKLKKEKPDSKGPVVCTGCHVPQK